MTTSSNSNEKISLAAALLNYLDAGQQLAYAQINPDLTIQQTSDNFSSILTLETDTAVGKNLTSILDEFIGAEETFRAIMEGEQETYSLNYVTRKTANGGPRYLDFQVINLNELFETPGLILIIKDVTTEGQMSQRLAQTRNDLRLAQNELTTNNLELQQLNNFKSFLLSMLAHDMRTPLAAIRGYSELVHRLLESNKAEVSSPKIFNFSNNIINITDQMTWLIRDIIDFDRAEKGQLNIQPEACNVRDIIEDTMQVHTGIINLQELSVTLDIDPPDIKMWADPLRIQQIINNLLGNAIKYSPNEGEITISVFAEGEEAAVRVTDNGRGMTPEQLDALFQPYNRTKEAAASNVVGSGLGLFIVDSLVKAQNGRIEVISDVEKGSSFTVYLPLANSEPL